MLKFSKKDIFHLFLLLSGVLLLLIFSGKVSHAWDSIANWLYKERIDKNAELLKVILTIIGGTAGIATIAISYRRLKSFQESVDNQREELKQNQNFRLDERFNNAQQQLGSENEVLILGAVQVLNEIAKKDPDNYAYLVLELFTTYISTEASLGKEVSNIKHNIINQVFLLISNNEYYKNFRKELSNVNLLNTKLISIDLYNYEFTNVIMPKKIEKVNFYNCNLNFVKFIPTTYSQFESNFLNKPSNRNNYGLISFTKFLNCEITNSLFSNITLRNVGFVKGKFYENVFDRTIFHNLMGRFNFTTFYLCNFKSFNVSLGPVCHLYASYINQSNWKQMITDNEFSRIFFHNTVFKGKVYRTLFLGCEYSKKDDIDLNDLEQVLVPSTSKLDVSNFEEHLQLRLLKIDGNYCQDLVDYYKEIPVRFNYLKTDYFNSHYSKDKRIDVLRYFW